MTAGDAEELTTKFAASSPCFPDQAAEVSFQSKTIGTILLALPGLVMWQTSESWVHRLAERLSSCTLTIALALTVLGLGIRIVSRYGWSRGHRLEQLGLAFALGWTLLTLCFLLLATLQIFHPQVWGPLMLVAYFWWGCGTTGSHNGWSAIKEFCGRRRAKLYLRKRYRWLSGALTLLLIAAAFCWSAGPVWDWDAEMYHLPNANFFLDHHGLAVSYDNEFPNLSGQAYLWYAIPIHIGLDAVPAMWMCLSTIVTSILAGGYAARWIGPRTGLWTPLVFWSGAIVTAVATTARTEPLVGVLLLATVVLLTPIVIRRERWSWPTIIAAGLLIGSAAGVKYQGLFAWPILALWMLASWLRSGSTDRTRSFAAMCAVWIIALVVTAPWWVKNWSAFGNPLYPVVSGSAASNSSPPTASNSAYGPAHQTRGVPSPLTMIHEFGLMFVNPNRLDGPPGQFPHYLFLLLPGLFWLRKQPVVSGCVLWGCAYYLLSFSLVAMPRYLFPIFPLWSICVAYLLSECESRYRLTVFFPGLLFFSTLFVLVLPARLLRTPLLAEYLIGKTDGRPLLRHIAHGYHDALDWINENTPADSRILMCWESREYRLKRAVTIDPLRTMWSSLWTDGRSTPEDIRRELKRRRYDYILVNIGSLKYNVSVTGHIPAEVLTTFETQRELLVPGVLTPVFQTGSAIVYRVQGE